jgi:hypothetical protein
MKRPLTIAVVLLLSCRVIAQDAVPTLFTVREVVVRPSKDAAYREGVKKLKAACEQHKVNVMWDTYIMSNNTYLYALPMKGMGDLDRNFFGELEKKMGKANLDKIWAEMDANQESYNDYSITTVTGITRHLPVPADQNFRFIQYWTPEPGKDAEAVAVLNQWHAAYEAKNIDQGYVAYKTVYGREPMYIIAVWAKDGIDFETTTRKRNEAFGADIGKLVNNMNAVTKSISFERGWKSTELSYAPK